MRYRIFRVVCSAVIAAGGYSSCKVATLALAFAVGTLWFAVSACAQPAITLHNFEQVLESYGPPHETQAKCRLRGAEARSVGPNLYAVTNAALETLSEDGQRQMLVEAPYCTYASGPRVATSPGPLKVQTADGQFSIEGNGFLWAQTNSSLFISNAVQSVVEPGLLEPRAVGGLRTGKPATNAPVHISSDEFDYVGETGESTYRRNVKVTGTNFVLTSGQLIVKLPLNERQLQDLTARESVVLDYGAMHAEAEQMVYSTRSGELQMTGQPWWRAEGREGRGDVVLLNRTNKLVRTVGNAFLKTPAQELGTAGLFGQGAPSSPGQPPATNQVVEVRSGSYDLQRDLAVFHDDVRAESKTGDVVQGRLRCRELTATATDTNQTPRIVAQDQVQVEQSDRVLTGGRAVYTGADQRLELSQQPAWRAGGREGSGDLIVLTGQDNQVSVSGNASMRLPASEVARLPGLLPGGAPPAKPAGAPVQFAEISSREYRFTREEGRFFGQVRVVHPQMDWSCEDLVVQMGGSGDSVQSMVAERAVSFDLTNEQGQRLHGTGRHSVYSSTVSGGRTNSVLRLTGQPAVLQTTNGVFENHLFILDLTENQLLAPGQYKIHGPQPVGVTIPSPTWDRRAKHRQP